MSRWPRMMWCLVALVGAAGCNQNRFLSPQAPSVWQPSPAAPQVAQLEDLSQRASALDADNRDLHAQLAKAEQRARVLTQHVDRLNKELQEKATQLQELVSAKQETDQQLRAVEASTHRRGSATITANNSLRASLPEVEIAGLEAWHEGDVVRIELPSERLFRPGTRQLLPTASQLLDQVAQAITDKYPRQIVGIEGHTDSVAPGATSNHQLSAEQAITIFQVFTTRNRLPARQLFTVGHGANHPRASNATPAGRAKNRRIEIVIYPEQF